MALPPNASRQRWLLLALTVFNFFFLLGARSLNEPDEGRYAEVAREMLELHDWLVPHIWYVPHLDKPPLTYWAVAASMAGFGRNEWAVRLPLALAGLSGVWAVYLLGCSLGGRRAGIWSALILQSSLLYFVMARMLTTDILLTQFIAWSLYFFWRSWRSLDALSDGDEAARARAAKTFFAWQLAAYTVIAFAFLTKGPVALAVPLVALVALAVHRRTETVRWQLLLLAALAGLTWLALLVAPWFIAVFQAVPKALDYMVKGQVAGHVLGTAIKNRQGSPFYFFGVLALGLLPWTPLLGGLWRREHWRGLGQREQEGWLFLTAAVVFTFALFSLTRAKLPAYILPLFPPLAVLLAVRGFGERTPRESPCPEPQDRPLSRLSGTLSSAAGGGEGRGEEGPSGVGFMRRDQRVDSPVQSWVWRVVMISPLLVMAAVPVVLHSVFEVADQSWLWPVFGLALGGLGLLLVLGRTWRPDRCAAVALGLGLLNLWSVAFVIPTVETRLKGNQTLKPLADALRREYRPGDAIVCWGRLPQGLPFYAFPVIDAAHRPYLGAISFDRPPYEFPDNRERIGKLVVPDEAALGRLLEAKPRVLVVGFEGTYRQAHTLAPNATVRLITRVGQWELLANH